jgi:hypothetical protein
MGCLVTQPTKEQAYSVQYTHCHPWDDFSLFHRLTPKHLATILSDVRCDECPAAYIKLTQDKGLKAFHYRSSTRKDAITGLEIKGVLASDTTKDTALAKVLERDMANNPQARLSSLIRDMSMP